MHFPCYRFFVVFIPLLMFSANLWADVVKPALIEISVYSDGHSRTEIRASIEALLTGINGQYRNTKDAPNADEYDALRVLPPEELHKAFESFKQTLIDGIELSIDGRPIPQRIIEVDIPEPGYTKVPRISLIVLEGEVPKYAEQLQWYYPARFGDNAVRVRQVDQQAERWHWSPHQWIRKDVPSEPFSLTEVYAQRPVLEIVADYTIIGMQHIVPMGIDHILFILGIFLLSTRFKPLFWQVTMFTVAHTITLGLSMLGYIELPARIVEPLIALSIAYVGIENIFNRRLQRHRLALVFAFGLLHGLGFAGALQDFGMPTQSFIPALLSFNLGVELGQIIVILAAFLTFGYWFRDKSWYRMVIIIPGSLGISAMGLLWTFERISF